MSTHRQSNSHEEDPLLDPKVMDGPKVSWTVADMFRNGPSSLAIAYHALGSGYGVFTPVGALVGGALYATNLWRPASMLNVWSMMGTSGLVGGTAGSVLALTKLSMLSYQGASAKPLPWTEEGRKMRLDGLSHNFKVRVLDLSVWMGVAISGVVVATVPGGPTALGLSKGSLGVFQALSLGSTLGSLSAMACIYKTSSKPEGN